MKKTSVGKKVFPNIEAYIKQKDEKFENWKEVDKIKFEKKQTMYRLDVRKN